MDHEASFFSALLHGGQPGGLRGVEKAHFTERFQPVYDWITEFARAQHTLPRPETVEGHFPGLRLPVAQEDVGFYALKVRENAMRVALEGGLTEHVVQPLEQSRATDALAGAKKVISDVARAFREPEKGLVLDLHGNTRTRWDDYELRSMAQDVIGLPLPWPTLTRMCGGIQIAETWGLLARPNVGKTWALVAIACFLWQLGYRVLFCSMETPPQASMLRDRRHRIIRGRCIRCNIAMLSAADTEVCPASMTPRQRLSIRFDAVGARLSAYRLLKGCLTPPERDVLWNYYLACGDPERSAKYGWGDLRIVSAPLIQRAADLDLEILEYQPDILLWDSAYLAAESFEKRTESTGHLVRDMKQMSERTGIPTIFSWHFNREVDEHATTASMNDAALTDEVARICDGLLALFRPPEVADAGEAIWRALKVRDGVAVRELKTHFKIKDEINFNEIGSSESA